VADNVSGGHDQTGKQSGLARERREDQASVVVEERQSMNNMTRTYKVEYTTTNGEPKTIELTVELDPNTKTANQIEQQVRAALAQKEPVSTIDLGVEWACVSG
jgi:hypothetical protein